MTTLTPALLSAKADIRRMPVAWAYLGIALIWGLAMMLITPPFQVPDENSHYYRAWSIADLQLVAQPGAGVTLPANVATLPERIGSTTIDWSQSTYSPQRARDLLWEPLGRAHVKRVTSAAGYGPIGYLPQAVGIDVVRILGHSPLLSVYLGRLCNLIVGSLLVFFAIRLVPFGKPLLALVALLPMVVFEMASLSPDALALSGFLLFLALVLRLSSQPLLTRGNAIAMVCAAAILLNAKPGFAPLVLLVFVLAPRQFGGARRYVLWVGATILLTGGISAIVMAFAPDTSPGYLASLGINGVDGTKQLDFILSHPWGYLKVLYRTLDQQGLILSQTAYGILGWLSVSLPFIGMVAVGLAAVLFLGVREAVTTTKWQRLVMCGCAAAYIATVSTALYTGWTAVWAPVVSGLQGRYFVPVLALSLFVVYGIRPRREWVIVAILGVAVTVAALTTLLKLVSFYY